MTNEQMEKYLLKPKKIQTIAANMDDQGDERYGYDEVIAILEAQIHSLLSKGWKSPEQIEELKKAIDTLPERIGEVIRNGHRNSAH